MTEAAKDSASASAAALLIHYSFDRGGNSTDELIAEWLQAYPANWVRLAVIEALYQGRYKAVSVTHILACWKRRNQPLYHFNHEFESLVCSKLPQHWKGEPDLKVGKAVVGNDSRSFELPKWLGDRASEAKKSKSPNVRADGKKQAGDRKPTDAIADAEARTPSVADANSSPKHTPPTADPPHPDALHSPDPSDSPPGPRPSKPATVPDTISDDVLGDLWLDRPEVDSVVSSSGKSGEAFRSSPSVAPKPQNTDSEGLLETQPEQSSSARQEPSTESNDGTEKLTPEEETASDGFGENLAKSPIHQFTPKAQSSDFYSKLKAVAQPRSDSSGPASHDKPTKIKDEG